MIYLFIIKKNLNNTGIQIHNLHSLACRSMVGTLKTFLCLQSKVKRVCYVRVVKTKIGAMVWYA